MLRTDWITKHTWNQVGTKEADLKIKVHAHYLLKTKIISVVLRQSMEYKN